MVRPDLMSEGASACENTFLPLLAQQQHAYRRHSLQRSQAYDCGEE